MNYTLKLLIQFLKWQAGLEDPYLVIYNREKTKLKLEKRKVKKTISELHRPRKEKGKKHKKATARHRRKNNAKGIHVITCNSMHS